MENYMIWMAFITGIMAVINLIIMMMSAPQAGSERLGYEAKRGKGTRFLIAGNCFVFWTLSCIGTAAVAIMMP